MKLGGRNLWTVLRAPLQRRHWRALANMALLYPRFLEGLRRYAFAAGRYPVRIPVRTPVGPIQVRLHTHHDMLTLNEVFCRVDYPAGAALRTAVDFGANIGVSALYFLTRNTTARVYLFEPLPRNVERLIENLRGYEARYVLRPVAVGLQDGPVEFGYEASGRYGGVRRSELPHQTTVESRDANAALQQVLDERGEIDILKIDVEGLEEPIVAHLRPEIASRIRAIYAECPVPIAAPTGFSRRRYGNVVHFRREPG